MARTRKSKQFLLPKGIKTNPVSLVDLMEITGSIELEYREKNEPIDPPTYIVAVGDDEQEHEHEHVLDDNGDIIKTTLETDDDIEVWNGYLNAVDRMSTEIAFYTTKYVLLEGVEIDWSQYEGWEDRKRKYRITVPDDPDDKKLYFITSVAFPTPEMQKRVAADILMKSAEGSDSDRIEAIEALFRG